MRKLIQIATAVLSTVVASPAQAKQGVFQPFALAAAATYSIPVAVYAVNR